MQRFPNFKSSIASRLFGKFASKEFPTFIQNIINKTYSNIMKLDLSEFDTISSYKSLNALFTRSFKAPRSFDNSENAIISPCDSRVSAFGSIENSLALQIKGFSYNVNDLLGDYIQKASKARLENGAFINFYLSPSDYHRYHAPMDMTIKKAIHIPAKLYPVNFKWLQKINGLFIENERVVLECLNAQNRLFYMVFVGALNVGKMLFNFDSSIQTNAKEMRKKCYIYENLFIEKGTELGRFEMGSTIVMFFEKDMAKAEVATMQKVRFGEVIAKLN